MSEIQHAKRFIIKYAFIGEDYTDESCDESITLSLINCAKMCASYSQKKDAEIERVRKQRNDYEKENDLLRKQLQKAKVLQQTKCTTNLPQVEQSLLDEAISDVITISTLNEYSLAKKLISEQFVVISKEDLLAAVR
jgi:hypothetical protein